jgi:hypothetical protein
MREDCEMRAALLFDAKGMSVFSVLTAADFSCQFLVRLLERSNTNVCDNAIEISKEIMWAPEVTIGLFCMNQEPASRVIFTFTLVVTL